MKILFGIIIPLIIIGIIGNIHNETYDLWGF
jgi:hypothetical protein